jgi:hypothetical protein
MQVDLGSNELTALDIVGYNLSPVPEPGSLAFVGLTATALSGYAWRRRRRAKSITSETAC